MFASVHATMPRPAALPAVAALRPLLGLSAALVAGGLLLLVVLAMFGAGMAWWAVVAGGFACASGVVAGATRRSALAVGLGLVSAAALLMALGASKAPEREAAFPSRENLPMARESAPGEQAAGAAKARGSVDRRDFVRSYYAALDAGDFEAAWARLSPQVQAEFGGLDAWRAGYGTTLGHEIEDLRVEGDVVRHVLVASDRTPCGGRTEQRFAVTWRLDRAGAATELSAVKLAGDAPAAAC
jgi:hypothetical protein